MLLGFLLALREGLEAALVIGMVLSILVKIGRSDLNRLVWGGLSLAIVVSALIAGALSFLDMEMVGPGEMIFEGTSMLLAAGILTWMILWVHRSNSNSRIDFEEKTRTILSEKNGSGIFFLAFLAVFREGVELALFMLAIQRNSSPLENYFGAITGLLGAAIVGWLLFSSTSKLSLRKFFRVSNVFLIIFAAGMVTSGVHEFTEAGIIPGLINPIWDLGNILSDSSQIGMLLQSLVGYHSAPTLTEIIAYFLYLGGIGMFTMVQKDGNEPLVSPVVN